MREILFILNPILFVSAVVLQPLLIYVIIFYSPPNLKNLKYVLLNTSFFQISHATFAFLTQFRQVSDLSPIQIWSYGPCRFLEAHVCYMMYHALQTSAMVSTLSAFFTIYMKYDASQYVIPSKKRIMSVALLLGCIVLVSVSCEITLIFIQSLPADIREHYKLLNQDLMEYAKIGIVDISVLPSGVNYVIINSLVVFIPLTAWYLRKKVSSKITPTIDMVSDAKRKQSIIFLNGLTIQVVLPLLLYVPIFMCQIFTTITKSTLVLQQYLIFVLPIVSTVFDPIISLIFVMPYRRQMMFWLGLDKAETVAKNTQARNPSAIMMT